MQARHITQACKQSLIVYVSVPAQTGKGLIVSSRFILKRASSTGKDLPVYLALTETTLCTGTQSVCPVPSKALQQVRIIVHYTLVSH